MSVFKKKKTKSSGILKFVEKELLKIPILVTENGQAC